MSRQSAVLRRPVELPDVGSVLRRVLAWWIDSVSALRPPVETR